MSLPAAPASRRKHGVYAAYRMGKAPGGRISSRWMFVTGHLRRGGQVQAVALDDVHLALLVRQLSGAPGGVGVDQHGWPDLGVAASHGHVEEQTDERALETRAGAGVEDEARAADLRAALEVEQAEPSADLPVRRSLPGGQRLAPGADPGCRPGPRRPAPRRAAGSERAAGRPRWPLRPPPARHRARRCGHRARRVTPCAPRLRRLCQLASTPPPRGCPRCARAWPHPPRPGRAPTAIGFSRRSITAGPSPLRAIARLIASGSSRMAWIEITPALSSR